MPGAAAGLLICALAAGCAAPASPVEPDVSRPRMNLALPTAGGAQIWADARWRAGWRIQEHIGTGHCRLLDPKNVRRAWGSYEACVGEMNALVPCPPDGAVPEGSIESRPLVILLHGMGRTRVSFSRMKTDLEAAGWRTARLSYPSTRRSIEEHAAWLERLIQRLDEDHQATEIFFITHSLGGIVVRATLARHGAWRADMAVRGMVMLGPPNQGSSFANRLAGLKIFRWLYGDTGVGLVPEEVRLIPAPDCPFLIIAGARGDGRGWNPLLIGEDDGVVTVAETHLDGAAGHRIVRSLHAFLPSHRDAIAVTLEFLTLQFAGGASTKS
jgi:pimeloyl-ACP methyl ester carboxylesterase